MREYCAYCGHKNDTNNNFDACSSCYDRYTKTCEVCGEKYMGNQTLVCSDRCLDKWYEQSDRDSFLVIGKR